MAGLILLGKHAIEIGYEYVQTDLEDTQLVGVSLKCADVKITFELDDGSDNMLVYHSSDKTMGSDLIEVIQPDEVIKIG